MEPANPNVALGNLICYRGSVLSQSPLVLDKFEQLDLLQKRTESALAQNPRRCERASANSAEIKSAAGKSPKPCGCSKTRLDLAPDDAVTQEMLVELLLDQLASDYAAIPRGCAARCATDSQPGTANRAAAHRRRRTRQTGQTAAAWDAYLRLADFTAEEPAYLRIDDHYTVRSDRWISSRLAAIWSAASADERKRDRQENRCRRPRGDKFTHRRRIASLPVHTSANCPGHDDVRLALAQVSLSSAIDRQEAEIELLQLVTSPDRAMQVAASELMAKSYAKPDQRDRCSKL